MESRNKKPKYLVVHPGKPHTDDMACGGIYRFLFGEVIIHRREPTLEELRDPTVHVVDVGGQDKWSLNNYDHHGKKSSLASCLMVWDNLVAYGDPEQQLIKATVRKQILEPISEHDIGNFSNGISLTLSSAMSSFVRSFSADYDRAYEAGASFMEGIIRGKVAFLLDRITVGHEWKKINSIGGGIIRVIKKSMDFIPSEWKRLAIEAGTLFFILEKQNRHGLPMVEALNGASICRDTRQTELLTEGRTAYYKTLDGAVSHALEMAAKIKEQK